MTVAHGGRSPPLPTPIFSHPHRVESLAGVISYDTIPGADSAWTVLARDEAGHPAVLEATFGEGLLLVIQPSPDRYVTGQVTPSGSLTAEACGNFIRNVVAYISGDG